MTKATKRGKAEGEKKGGGADNFSLAPSSLATSSLPSARPPPLASSVRQARSEEERQTAKESLARPYQTISINTPDNSM